MFLPFMIMVFQDFTEVMQEPRCFEGFCPGGGTADAARSEAREGWASRFCIATYNMDFEAST